MNRLLMALNGLDCVEVGVKRLTRSLTDVRKSIRPAKCTLAICRNVLRHLSGTTD